MSSRLLIESIGSEAELRPLAMPEDVVAVEGLSNEHRRCEVLAWRAMVRRELGRDIAIFYDEYGAPNVALLDTYISISHSRDVVALLISDAPCAVDVEYLDRNFRGVASKYLSATEQALAEEYDIYAELWSAKETLYKYYRKGSLDLVQHISIEEYSPTDNTFVATILGGDKIVVKIDKREAYVVTSIAR